MVSSLEEERDRVISISDDIVRINIYFISENIKNKIFIIINIYNHIFFIVMIFLKP